MANNQLTTECTMLNVHNKNKNHNLDAVSCSLVPAVTSTYLVISSLALQLSACASGHMMLQR